MTTETTNETTTNENTTNETVTNVTDPNSEMAEALYSNTSNETQTSEVSEDSNENEVATTEETNETNTEETKDEVNYELKLGENNLLAESFVEKTKEFAKENNLTNEQAQAILDKQNEAVNEYLNAENQKLVEELEGWRKQVIDDPVMGGNNLKATAENARRVVERFGTPEFTEILKTTGYGDHPEVVRFLSTLGSVMADDSLILGKAGASKEVPVEDLFYGNNKK